MSVMEINLLIQLDWINQKSSIREIEEGRKAEKERKAWAKYYEDCLRRGITVDPLKKFNL